VVHEFKKHRLKAVETIRKGFSKGVDSFIKMGKGQESRRHKSLKIMKRRL